MSKGTTTVTFDCDCTGTGKTGATPLETGNQPVHPTRYPVNLDQLKQIDPGLAHIAALLLTGQQILSVSQELHFEDPLKQKLESFGRKVIGGILQIEIKGVERS